MDNAIKFSQSGSVLTFGVKEETLDDDRANFTFYCKDQGVGMSEDFIAHVFDMFSQESKTSRSRYEDRSLSSNSLSFSEIANILQGKERFPSVLAI